MIAIAVQTSFGHDIQHIRGTSPAAICTRIFPPGLSARHIRQHGLVVINPMQYRVGENHVKLVAKTQA